MAKVSNSQMLRPPPPLHRANSRSRSLRHVFSFHLELLHSNKNKRGASLKRFPSRDGERKKAGRRAVAMQDWSELSFC